MQTREPYPTDLTDSQWEKIKPLLPPERPVGSPGRPRRYPLREIVNAILYLLRSGCAWRLLHDFPPYVSVWGYFRCWRKDGTWQRVHDALRADVRRKAGKEATPSAAIIDSQSVKTTEQGGERGYDAGKKVNGRKRHLVVDTLGLVWQRQVQAANVQDRDGAKAVLEPLDALCPRLERIWADSAYAGELVQWVASVLDCVLEIVKRPDDAQGFVVLPHRWIVERTLAWLGKFRRLSKDYERTTASSEAWIDVAMINLMVRRLAPT